VFVLVIGSSLDTSPCPPQWWASLTKIVVTIGFSSGAELEATLEFCGFEGLVID
jgi:hypothetical protein